MSIFVTGDIHASYDIAKLSESCFNTAGLTKDDYVIICGDFGLVWNNFVSNCNTMLGITGMPDSEFKLR